MQGSRVLAGRYCLVDRLGSGGMSTVWRVHDVVLDRDVAVKVLAGRYAAEPDARQRIRMEAQAVARLSHPNITNVFDYGEATDDSGACVPFVVMELLSGRTLAERLARGPLSPRTALRLCSEVARALSAAHQAGLVHRDVKPSNVMVTASGAKVFDFGIAAAVGRSELEVDGQLLGTPAYLAPERLAADVVSPASDVYALGLLLYRALTGRLPWRAETTTQMLRAHTYFDPAPLPALPGVPAAVIDVCNQCLAKEPAERPTAAEVADLLAVAAGISPLPGVDDPNGAPDQAPLAAATIVTDRAGGQVRSASRTGDSGAPGVSADSPHRTSGRRGSRLRVVAVAVATAVLAGAAAAGLLLPGGWRSDDDRRSEAGVPAPSVGNIPTSSPAPSRSPSAAAVPQPTATRSPQRAGPVTGVPETPTTVPERRDPRATAAGPPAGLAVTAKGGVVRIRCVGRNARVVQVEPAAGYTIKDHDPGPATEVQVVLLSARNESEIKVTCGSDGPIPTIKESPQ